MLGQRMRFVSMSRIFEDLKWLAALAGCESRGETRSSAPSPACSEVETGEGSRGGQSSNIRFRREILDFAPAE